MTKAQNEKIQEPLKEANEKLEEAAKIADEIGEAFYWEAPADGSGCTYYSDKYASEWEQSNIGWTSSTPC